LAPFAHGASRGAPLGAGIGIWVVLALLLFVSGPGPNGVSPGRVPARIGLAHALTGTSRTDRPAASLPTLARSASTGGESWANASAQQLSSPPASAYASEAYDPVDQWIVLFGGCSAVACPTPAQTWIYSGGSWRNITALSAQPPARYSGSMAFDARSDRLVLFGGYAGANGRARPLNDTWTFTGGVWTNDSGALPLAPVARGGASMVYDAADGYVLLFGGCGAGIAPGCALNDTWAYNGTTNRWNPIPGGPAPPPRELAQMAWDGADNYVLLLGGGAGGPFANPINDSWTFHGGRWQNVTAADAPLPAARLAGVLAYDPLPNKMVLTTGIGSGGTPLVGTWTFKSGAWTNLSGVATAAPPERFAAASAEDFRAWTNPAGAPSDWPYVLLFGGLSDPCSVCAPTPVGDTWVFEKPPQAIAAAIPTGVEVGAPVKFTASEQAGTGPFRYAWTFGDGTGLVARYPTHAYAAAGTYTAVLNVTDSAGVVGSQSVLISVSPGPAGPWAWLPTSADVGLAVQFRSTPSGGTPPYTVHWSFGDGMNASSWSPVHTYAAAGRYPISLTVTDSAAGSTTRFGNLTVNSFPVLRANVSNLSSTLGASLSALAVVTGGTPPYSFTWAFGDGDRSSAARAAHAYARVGSYAVEVWVNDSAGASLNQSFRAVVAPSSGTQHANPSPLDGAVWAIALVLVVAAVAVAALALRRERRRRRRAPPRPYPTAPADVEDTPLAAVAAGQTWDDDTPSGDSRTSRRAHRR
jgi:PKD repeat protein